jgi:hypothetical protein
LVEKNGVQKASFAAAADSALAWIAQSRVIGNTVPPLVSEATGNLGRKPKSGG